MDTVTEPHRLHYSCYLAPTKDTLPATPPPMPHSSRGKRQASPRGRTVAARRDSVTRAAIDRNNKEPYFKYTPLNYRDTFTRHVGISDGEFTERHIEDKPHDKMTRAKLFGSRKMAESADLQNKLWRGVATMTDRVTPKRSPKRTLVLKPGFTESPRYSTRGQVFVARQKERQDAARNFPRPHTVREIGLGATYSRTIGQATGTDFEGRNTERTWQTTNMTTLVGEHPESPLAAWRTMDRAKRAAHYSHAPLICGAT
eukprot:COSAG05_NODE_1308_length_5225_cov_3.554233_7_plen_257_part_00